VKSSQNLAVADANEVVQFANPVGHVHRLAGDRGRMSNEIVPSDPKDFLLYQTVDGNTRIEVRLVAETVWLSLNQLAELFQRDKSVISKHIANVFAEGELDAKATVANFATVQTEGQSRRPSHLPSSPRPAPRWPSSTSTMGEP